MKASASAARDPQPGGARAARKAVLATLALTVLAWLENTAAPWAPFYVLYAAAAVAIPYRMGAVRFRRPGAWWHWPGAVVLALALQSVAGAQLGVVQPAVLGALGVPGERLHDAYYFFPAALPAMFAAAAERLPAEPGTIANAYFAFIVLWAGAGEEILYRGYLHRTLSRSRGFAVAAVVSSALFAARHLTQLALVDPYPWPAAVSWAALSFVLGIVFAWLYERTGSLTLPVVAHYAFNLIPFLAR
jgi:membrane protease YdiL (CAAX protease family)